MKTSRSEDSEKPNSERRDKRLSSKRTRERREEKMRSKTGVTKPRQLMMMNKLTRRMVVNQDQLKAMALKKSLMLRPSKLLKWKDLMKNTHLTKFQTKSWTMLIMISILK